MNRKLFIVVIIFTAFGPESYSQFSFGVSSGLTFNSGYFGYNFNNKAVGYLGLQYINGNITGEMTYEDFDYDLMNMVTYTEDNSLKGGIYIPTIGVKFFIAEKNKLKAYLNANISKPIINAKVEFDGDEDEDVKNTVDALSFFGGEAGFGVEYFFDDNFSIGGEFGLRLIRGKYEYSDTRWVYNYNTDEDEQTTYETTIKANINPTYAKFCLNFYF